MPKFIVVLLAVLFILTPGCLVVSKISYSIQMKTKTTGTVKVKFHDIRSDAIGNKEFEDDKKNLFEYLLKSEDFSNSMQSEGKTITSRRLEIYDNKLNGIAVYNFNDIEKIEGIRYRDGYYFLTLQAEDSVLYTNGEILSTEDYKRIIWADGTKTLEFEIQSGQVMQDTRDLAPVYKSLPK